jgi:hypothetical protein
MSLILHVTRVLTLDVLNGLSCHVRTDVHIYICTVYITSVYIYMYQCVPLLFFHAGLQWHVGYCMYSILLVCTLVMYIVSVVSEWSWFQREKFLFRFSFQQMDSHHKKKKKMFWRQTWRNPDVRCQTSVPPHLTTWRQSRQLSQWTWFSWLFLWPQTRVMRD